MEEGDKCMMKQALLSTEAVFLDYEITLQIENDLCRIAFPFRLDYLIGRYLGQHSNQMEH